MNSIDRVERAAQAWEDRLLNDYLTDLPECPECGQESLEVTGGKDRRGWWSDSECLNDECDYTSSDFDIYDDE
jgi:hypothetical protein